MFKIIIALLLMTTPAWATLAWRNGTGANTLLGTSNASDIDTNTQNNIVFPLDSLLANYHQSLGVYYASASALTVGTGSVTVSNSDGSIRLMLYNSGTTSVDFTNIDTGSEASSTTYYVYAIAASASATAATFKISASSTAPSGVTYYKKIATFINDGSSNINPASITSEPYGNSVNDSNGSPMVQAILDYGTSSSSFTNKTGALKVVFGNTGTLSGCGGSFSITNLPFSSSSSYMITTAEVGGSGGVNTSSIVSQSSGSAASITNGCVPAGSQVSASFNWVAIGI